MRLLLYHDAGDFVGLHPRIIGIVGAEKTNIAFIWLLMLTHGYQDTGRYRCLVSIHNFHSFRVSSKIPRNPAAMQGKSLAANKSKPCLNLIRYLLSAILPWADSDRQYAQIPQRDVRCSTQKGSALEYGWRGYMRQPLFRTRQAISGIQFRCDPSPSVFLRTPSQARNPCPF